MATDRVLPFHSAHHNSHKWGIVKNLVHRAMTVCSDTPTLQGEISKLKSVLKSGGYPKRGVERCISQVKLKMSEQLDQKSVVESRALSTNEGGRAPDNQQRWGLTYHPNIFEEIQRKLKNFDIDVVPGNYSNLKRLLTNVKDVTSLQETKGAIYKLCCTDCDATYVGETGQKLATRIYRHHLAEKK